MAIYLKTSSYYNATSAVIDGDLKLSTGTFIRRYAYYEGNPLLTEVEIAAGDKSITLRKWAYYESNTKILDSDLDITDLVCSQPSISSVTDDETDLTISGTNLSLATEVTFDDAPLVFVVVDNDTITVSGTLADAGEYVVITPCGTASFTV